MRFVITIREEAELKIDRVDVSIFNVLKRSQIKILLRALRILKSCIKSVLNDA